MRYRRYPSIRRFPRCGRPSPSSAGGAQPRDERHRPVLLGGESDHTLKRVCEFGDGWLPRAVGGFDARQTVDRLRRMASAAGRDPSTLSITVFGAPADPAVLSEYRQSGIQRALLEVPDLSREEILRVIDKNATLTEHMHV